MHERRSRRSTRAARPAHDARLSRVEFWCGLHRGVTAARTASECGTNATWASMPVQPRAAQAMISARAGTWAFPPARRRSLPAQRVMGAVAGFAARAGAAGDRGDEQFGRGRAVHRQQRHRGQQRRGGEAAGMRHRASSADLAQVFRHRAPSKACSRAGAPCAMLVYRLVSGFSRSITKVGRDV